MSLLIMHQGEDAGFMDLLLEGVAFSDETGELETIRDTHLENTSACKRLCEMNPRCRESYLRQLEQATADLEARVLRLNVPGVRKA